MEDISSNSDFLNIDIPSPLRQEQGLVQNFRMELRNETSPRNNEIIETESASFRVINKDKEADTVFRESRIPREVFENERVRRFFCYERLPDQTGSSIFSFGERNNPDRDQSPNLFESPDGNVVRHFAAIGNDVNLNCCSYHLNTNEPGPSGLNRALNFSDEVYVQSDQKDAPVLEQHTGASTYRNSVNENQNILTPNVCNATGNTPVAVDSVLLLPELIGQYDKRVKKYPGTKFFVTLNFGFRPTHTDKLLFLNNMELKSNKIISYCVSVEESKEIVCHIHSYLEYSEPLYIQELCEYIRCIYLDCKSIDVHHANERKLW